MCYVIVEINCNVYIYRGEDAVPGATHADGVARIPPLCRRASPSRRGLRTLQVCVLE